MSTKTIVLGIGGGGGNVVEEMFTQTDKPSEGIEYWLVNTDKQRLSASKIPNQLHIGKEITAGLGSGANPSTGKKAAIDSIQDFETIFDNVQMAFLVAGLGGGTGSGSTPVIAEFAKKKGILTIAIVSIPFLFEGKKKNQQALEALALLKEKCDSVIVTSADIIRQKSEKLSISDSFKRLDFYLADTINAIIKPSTKTYINIDFSDFEYVLKSSQYAISGTSKKSGKDRALSAITDAYHSSLLKYNQPIHKYSRAILIIVSKGSPSLEMDELTTITDFLQKSLGDEAEIIFGHGENKDMDEEISVSLIVSGIPSINFHPNESSSDKLPEIEISIDHGNAPKELVAELLANLSFRYELMNDGSGINFEFLGVKDSVSMNIEP